MNKKINYLFLINDNYTFNLFQNRRQKYQPNTFRIYCTLQITYSIHPIKMYENYKDLYNLKDCLNFQLKMNFLKRMMGFGNDSLQTKIKNNKIQGTFYKIIEDKRNIIFPECLISILQRENNYFLQFENTADSKEEAYEFPVYLEMTPVSFTMNKAGKVNACFEWVLDEENQRVGCYMNPDKKDIFKDILCLILKKIANDDNIKDHLDFCKQLPGIPVYKKIEQKSSSSKLSTSSRESLNEVLMKQAAKKDNKMVHTAILYQIIANQRSLVKDNVVFALSSLGNFTYQFNVINQTGYCFLKKELSPGLVYEINTDLGYLKWLQISEQSKQSKIYEVNFEGKRDAAMSLKFDIMECMYEINTKRKLTDAVAEDEVSYLKRMNEKHPVEMKQNATVVKFYEQEKDEKDKIEEIEQKMFVYNNEEAKKGLEKYRTFTQGKIHDISVAALGSMLQSLKIDQNNQIKSTSHQRLFSKSNIQVDPNVLLLHDSDNKIMAIGQDGKLYYQDLNKQKLINQYEIDKQYGLIDIHPQSKFADTGDYKTFKAISKNAIYEIDPRIQKGSELMKKYSTEPDFNTMSVDQKGRFAIGSHSGEIRLYNKIGSNANCKYSSFGDKVIHLQSTKDGRWLLATFPKFLILLPTQTQDEQSLYERKIPFKQRLSPIKLTIMLEHLQLCKVSDLQFIPAKFDENSNSRQKYIVSGFGDYVVVWNLSQIIRGEIWNYKFSKTDGKLLQVDFRYNDIRKLIMVSEEGIKIKENKIKTK